MDNKNNVISSTQKPFIYFIAVPASFHDLVINEIFADPSPQIGLPAFEFIEIHNTSTNVYDLNDWSLSIGSTSKNIESFILVPGAYLILCHEDDTFSYKFYGDVIGLSSFSLTNTGSDLYLNDNNGTLIDEVHYEDSWYNDNDKSDGGYSLELINPEHPCQSPSNWTASENTNGGTPGSQNSVYDNTADTEGSSISKINIVSNNEIEVILSETMDSSSVANGTYSFDNKDSLNVLFVNTSGPYFNSINLQFTTALKSSWIYTLTVNGLKDCSGNLIGSNNTAEFIFPDTASSSDMIINEVMVNPVGTGTDYVELYNNSSKYIDLKNWSIATFDDDLNAVSSEKIISESTSIVYPGEYVLISKDNQNILEQYPYTNDSNFIEIESLPTYSNESGSVIILDDKDTIIDRFDYHEDLHFVLLDSYDGVALERLDFDRTTQDATNWTSAAETVGFGTPGYKNSQTLVANFTGDKVNVDPEIFSPDNDGYKDLLNINYEFETEGTVANISIYDAKGNLVRQLVKNELLGKSGSYSWDGTNEINEKAKVGIHIIYFEIFDVNGNVESHKKTCVVASKL
ncbi:MAG TPA: hypothetical protein EYQ86_07035 [Bacteroidetes bacterium]|nr:hypothetical protein [Bacteroidota bacterium]